MFITQKRNGTIKARGCADGRKQRDWMNSDETSSSTVATQALLLSAMIDAYEGRDVATSDIPGAFLQTPDDSKETHLRLEGLISKIFEKKLCFGKKPAVFYTKITYRIFCAA